MLQLLLLLLLLLPLLVHLLLLTYTYLLQLLTSEYCTSDCHCSATNYMLRAASACETSPSMRCRDESLSPRSRR
jgi:hypothetical protein